MYWMAIGLGAAVGACLRAWLARFNGSLNGSLGTAMPSGVPPWLPLGTLLANVLGGLLIGVALMVFIKLDGNLPASAHANLRGMVITGFLGGLTTFSTFSAEVFALLQQGNVLAGLALIGLHVLLTLSATAVGFYAMQGLLG